MIKKKKKNTCKINNSNTINIINCQGYSSVIIKNILKK